ncbi:hypothetical protein SAMN04515656_1035 [Eubacterium aggregans]|uniref:Uncharacterized protein n=1 Tax=Eubacterium aggregans TaxID=81409 RepID=A0A1H3XZQ2_9FIRM|nr:hypothetical protein [Eubacterium aggregans]SEA04955.1 hypothetical protein SAMN04515656_1035 [Eubacterium aggregans]
MEKMFIVSGSVTEWIDKSEQALKICGFEDITAYGLRGYIESTYDKFDRFNINISQQLDGKVKIEIDTEREEMIPYFKETVAALFKGSHTQQPQSSPTVKETNSNIHRLRDFEDIQNMGNVKQTPQQRYQSSTIAKNRFNFGGCVKIVLIFFGVIFLIIMLYSCFSTGTTTVKNIKLEDCQNIPYEDLARSPDQYKSQSITISGTVIQVIESGSDYQYRVAVDGNYDEIFFVSCKGVSSNNRVLQNDTVQFWGAYNGLITYDSALGGPITIPSLIASGYNILN